MLVTQLETWCSLHVLQVNKNQKISRFLSIPAAFRHTQQKRKKKRKKEKQLHCTAILRYIGEVLMQLVWLVYVACSTLRHGA